MSARLPLALLLLSAAACAGKPAPDVRDASPDAAVDAGAPDSMSPPASGAWTAGLEPLLAHWPLESVEPDGSVKATAGPAGMADRGRGEVGLTVAPGRIGQALTFDADDSISFGDWEGADFGTGDFSVVLWIRTSWTSTGSYPPFLVSKRSPGGQDNFWEIRLRPAGSVWFSAEQDVAGTNHNEVATQQLVSDGKWHMVAAVRRKATFELYVDGTLDVARSGPGIVNLANAHPLRLGRGPDGNNQLAGALDEVAIFGRALTAAEIAAIQQRVTATP
jgi:hypothetical protein